MALASQLLLAVSEAQLWLRADSTAQRLHYVPLGCVWRHIREEWPSNRVECSLVCIQRRSRRRRRPRAGAPWRWRPARAMRVSLYMRMYI